MTERGRDRLGRPLPDDADPSALFPPVDVAPDASDVECWSLVVDYLAQGLPFHAHEVCEMRWRVTESDERTLWKALAQWCAALTHELRGNAVGARSLAQKAIANLDATSFEPAWLDRSIPRRDCTRLMQFEDA